MKGGLHYHGHMIQLGGLILIATNGDIVIIVWLKIVFGLEISLIMTTVATDYISYHIIHDNGMTISDPVPILLFINYSSGFH